MRYLWLPTQSPYVNLATEEYLLTHSNDEVFMLWQNSDSVIIGRHQNTLAEINQAFVEANKIPVVRRMTGGGAVFHDLGNLNFSFIRNVEPHEKEIDFKKFLRPIVGALQELGVPAAFSGRNDLVVHDRKISGNAMMFYENRVLEHGTLLFSTVSSNLVQALRADPDKFRDKAVKSVRSRVTNIAEHLPRPMTVMEFKDCLMNYILRQEGVQQLSTLDEHEEEVISRLANEKYATWEWNYGQSPKYAIDRKVRTQGGTVQVVMDVRKGVISDARFYGDFFSRKDPDELAKALIGIPYAKPALLNVLQNIDVEQYFNGVTSDDLLGIIL